MIVLFPLSGSGPFKHLTFLPGGGRVCFKQVMGNWCMWRMYSPLLLASAQNFKLHLSFNSKIKHKHIFYSSSVLIVDGRKCSLVIKTRDSVTAFAATSLKTFFLSLHWATCSL